MKEVFDYNTITFEDMKEYIEKNAPEDKAWFKSIAIGNRKILDKEGRVKKTIKTYNHLTAKRKFCEKYMPDIIPVRKERENKTKILEDW